MADDLERQEGGGQCRDGAGEMLEVLEETLRLHPLPVVIDEDRQGAAGRDVQLASRRHKTGDQTDHVGAENEESDRADHGKVFFPALADDVREDTLDNLVNGLEEALPAGGGGRELPGGEAEQGEGEGGAE